MLKIENEHEPSSQCVSLSILRKGGFQTRSESFRNLPSGLVWNPLLHPNIMPLIRGILPGMRPNIHSSEKIRL